MENKDKMVNNFILLICMYIYLVYKKKKCMYIYLLFLMKESYENINVTKDIKLIIKRFTKLKIIFWNEEDILNSFLIDT